MLVWQALPCWNGWFADPDPATDLEAGGGFIKKRAEVDEGLINHLFNKIDENFLPFKIKLVDLNLFYNVHITKSSN